MADNNSDVLQEIRDRFAISHSAEAHNRIKGVDDLRFLNGDQWPANIRREREKADRPCETINKLPSHLDQILVDKGQEVQRGQVIGYMGSSGLSTGPHLHYEVGIGTQVVDPIQFLNIKSPLIKKSATAGR